MRGIVRKTFRQQSRPLMPLPTGTAAVLRPMPGISAVLWDVYGTLLISASGDVGVAARSGRADALLAALTAAGARLPDRVRPEQVGPVGVQCLLAVIEGSHRQARARGIQYPEVEIRAVWRQVLGTLVDRGLIQRIEAVDVERLAAQYEAAVNPCWPMPHVHECLAALRRADRVMGIISNAQFYTAGLLAELLGDPLSSLGFDRRLRYYSYRHRRAKPGVRMFSLAATALRRRGLTPGQTLYVGNDMLNDILPAQQLGYHTALFAGDRRSLRRRQDDPRVAGVVPDLVLTDLATLAPCLRAD